MIILAACGFAVAGVLSSVAAQRWSDDVLGRVPGALPFADVFTRDIEEVRNGIAATAVSSTLQLYYYIVSKKNGIMYMYSRLILDCSIFARLSDSKFNYVHRVYSACG